MRSPLRLLVVLVVVGTAASCLGVAAAALVEETLDPGLPTALAVVTPAGGSVLSGPGPGTAVMGESSAAAAAVSWALAQLGTPYRWGGEGDGGFDCSGLVQAAFGAAGVRLPRVAQDQYDAGPRLPARTPLLPGDLVFFGSSPAGVDHVGMVVASGEMVDAPHTGAVVRVEPIWTTGYVGATRPAP